MRIGARIAIISSTFLLSACAYHRPPVVYTTPGGQVIAAGANPQSAADHALETSLHAELNRYGDLARANPNVQFYARDGTVTLSGPVRSESDRQVLDAMVRNTPGVRSVNDQLHVLYPPTGVVTPPSYSPGAPVYPPPVVTTPAPPVSVPRIEATTPADQALAQRIADQLRTDSVPADWLQNMTIRVDNGAAYLQGSIPTQTERQTIDSALQRVRGITAIYDQLQLR